MRNESSVVNEVPKTERELRYQIGVLAQHYSVEDMRGFLLGAREAFADEVRRSSGELTSAEATESRERRMALAELIEELESTIHLREVGRG